MRTRDSLLSICAVLAACIAPGPFAHAGWSPTGATIRSTTNSIPKLAAANDGALGSIVAWQEESSAGSGVLRAQHVLATGDPDPTWPSDGALLCATLAARPAVGVVPDRLGGAYVWWKEGTTLYLTRVAPNGAVAAGWPARGRMLGSIHPANVSPSAIEDGAHGVYLGWSTMSMFNTDFVTVNAMHLGPANTGAGGWPNGIRAVAGGDPVNTWDYWPHLALAPDGGLFVSWARLSDDPNTVNSAFLLRRLTSAGLNAAGWPSEGMELAPFHGEWLSTDPNYPYIPNHPAAGMVGLDADGRGGVFALLGIPTGPPQDTYQGATVEIRLLRLQGDGSPAADWPAGGSLIASGPTLYTDGGPDASYRVLSDGFDGCQVGLPNYYDHGTDIRFAGLQPNGVWKPASTAAGVVTGYDMVPNATGGVFLADFVGTGPNGPYSPYAFLRVSQTQEPAGWSPFFEIHYEPVIQWYGDIALASTGDGGAVMYWSQVNQLHGLFARRFNAAGEVTGVSDPGPLAATLALSRLRFVAGEGVRASLTLAGGDAARLDLFDVGGRRVASSRLEGFGAGAHEVAIDGTAALPSGLYFARLASARANANGRVIVTH